MEEKLTILDNEMQSELRKPPIYSRTAIYAFSFFFSSFFGGVLLYQNLVDIGEKKVANRVLVISLLYTVAVILINLSETAIGTSSLNLILNIGGAVMLSEFYYKKYFPEGSGYPFKKVWKPMLVALLIVAFFTGAYLLSIYGSAIQ